jgi:biopolymer transport protein TolR
MKADMRAGRGHPRRAMNEINVVPYIDVMLVLLVIFMVTAPMVNPGVLDLPSVAKSNQTQNQPPVEVNINANGDITVRDRNNGQETSAQKGSIATVVKRVKGKDEDRPVVIAADKSVKYEQVMNVMDELQRAAIPRVGLLVKPAP